MNLHTIIADKQDMRIEIDRLRAELAAAQAALREAEKDAERYRWLRVNSTQPTEEWSTHSDPESLDSAVDAAIDAARKGE